MGCGLHNTLKSFIIQERTGQDCLPGSHGDGSTEDIDDSSAVRTAVTGVRLQNLGGDEVSLAFRGKALEEAVEVVVLLLKGDHLGGHVIGGTIKVLRGVEAGVQEPSKAEDVDIEVLAGHYGVVNGAETAKPETQTTTKTSTA